MKQSLELGVLLGMVEVPYLPERNSGHAVLWSSAANGHGVSVAIAIQHHSQTLSRS